MLEMIRIQLLALDSKRKKNKFDLKFGQSCGKKHEKMEHYVCLPL